MINRRRVRQCAQYLEVREREFRRGIPSLAKQSANNTLGAEVIGTERTTETHLGFTGTRVFCVDSEAQLLADETDIQPVDIDQAGIEDIAGEGTAPYVFSLIQYSYPPES